MKDQETGAPTGYYRCSLCSAELSPNPRDSEQMALNFAIHVAHVHRVHKARIESIRETAAPSEAASDHTVRRTGPHQNSIHWAEVRSRLCRDAELASWKIMKIKVDPISPKEKLVRAIGRSVCNFRCKGCLTGNFFIDPKVIFGYGLYITKSCTSKFRIV